MVTYVVHHLVRQLVILGGATTAVLGECIIGVYHAMALCKDMAYNALPYLCSNVHFITQSIQPFRVVAEGIQSPTLGTPVRIEFRQ